VLPCHLQVAEIALLNTTLVRADGARIYWPNARLNNESLFNLSRSTNKAESIKVQHPGASDLYCTAMHCCVCCFVARVPRPAWHMCHSWRLVNRHSCAAAACVLLSDHGPSCTSVCSCRWTSQRHWKLWRCCGAPWMHT